MSAQPVPPDFALAAKLGAALARPFATLDRDAWGLGSQSPAEMLAFSRHPAFARPVERALRAERAAGLDLPLSAEAVAQALASPAGRLAALLVGEPLARVEKAALLCAAAAMQRQVLAQVQKIERQRARAILGAEGFAVATQEAPTLHPGFAELGSPRLFGEAMAPELDEAAARRRLVDFGLKLLLDLVARAQPAFAKLFAARLSAPAHTLAAGADVAPQERQLLKFVRRRMPEWSAIIG